VKLKKSQIKELIKQEIKEYKETLDEVLPSIAKTIEVEEGKMDALKTIATKAGKKLTPALKKAWQKAKPHAKEVGQYAADKAIDVGKDYLRSKVDKKFGMKKEGDELEELKFGSQAQYDSYKKKHDIKPGTTIDVAGKKSKEKGKGKMTKKAKSLGDKMADKLNKRMADLEKKSKEGRVKESKGRRCTVKEIKKWMRGLEENRYKKTYNSDARRVSWMVNNSLSEDYDTMPVSMQKKWPKAAYKRERFLAKEFVKHLNTKQMNEQRLRETIRKIIKEIRG
tara:strand:+ start:443 stop:1282 length:840 start_codon:yes stop_codon:yes gene_type:complete